MLREEFKKYKTNKTWKACIKHKNMLRKLKRKSVNNYFPERSAGGTNLRAVI